MFFVSFLYLYPNILDEFNTTKIEDALCIIAAAIGFKNPSPDRSIPIIFTQTANTQIFCFIIEYVFLLRAIVSHKKSILSDISVISDASDAISVPAIPIAIPTLASVRAGASLIPSPIIATCFPLDWSSFI